MNRVYNHINQDNKKSILKWLLAIIPLIVYGIYKNGILLYQKNLVNIYGVFRPLWFILIPFIINYIIHIIKDKKYNIDYNILSWLLVDIFMPPHMSLTIYGIIIGIMSILASFMPKNINWAVLTKIIIVLILMVLNKYTYYNYLELETSYSFSILDLLWGRSIGGVCSTSTIYGVVCYLVLLTNIYYKKEITIISTIIYSACSIIYFLICRDISIVTTNIAGVLIAFITIGSLPHYTPYLPKARVMYASLLGLFTFIINIWFPYEGVFITLFVLSVIANKFDKIIYSIRSK